MNNYFVNICARAFCNADAYIDESNNKEGGKRQDRYRKYLEKKKDKWNNKIITAYNDHAQDYYDFIQKRLE